MNYTDMSTIEIKKSLGYNENEIVEPVKLAEKLGIDLVETTLDQEQDGAKILCAIVNKDDGASVFYHKRLIDDVGSERVALTYALLHYLGDKSNIMITSRTIITEREEALIYEMLMPKNLVINALIDGASINDLSEGFNVPKRFVRERLDAMPVIAFGDNRMV